MKVKKLLTLSVIIFGMFNQISSQEIIYTNDSNDKSYREDSSYQDANATEQTGSKLNYSLNIGSSFTSSKNYGNLLCFYTSPQLKYKIKPRLEIKAGLLLLNTNINSYSSENRNKSSNQAYFMTGFDYNANQRLKISGEILYGMNKSPYAFSTAQKSPEYYIRMSAEYKISESLSIGLQIVNQKMNQGNYFYPYEFGGFNRMNTFNPLSAF
jgi:hypothetical protein